MPLSMTNKTQIRNFYTTKKLLYLNGVLIRTGEGRNDESKEANYKEISTNLLSLGINNRREEIEEAAEILGRILVRTVEVQAPPNDNGAARKLAAVNRDSAFQVMLNGVGAPIGTQIDVRLDVDQLKHQHPTVIIGTRAKGGGNRFIATACTQHVHQTMTMQHMANWAQGLAGMIEGEQRFHGQAVPVNNIHYEGFCLLSGGQKYVLFHCYPADGSPSKM